MVGAGVQQGRLLHLEMPQSTAQPFHTRELQHPALVITDHCPAVIEGNLAVRKPKGWSSSRRKPVKVVIGEDVQVLGDLIFEHAVELKIHDSARVGEVIGDEVKVVKG